MYQWVDGLDFRKNSSLRGNEAISSKERADCHQGYPFRLLLGRSHLVLPRKKRDRLSQEGNCSGANIVFMKELFPLLACAAFLQ